MLTGVAEIDSQHKELFAAVNSFVQSILDGREKDDIATLFRFLDHYANVHFATEEALLEKENYPEINIHKAQHNYFRTAFAKLKARCDNEGYSQDILNDAHRNVSSWLLNHVAKTDKHWAQFIKSRQQTAN